MSTYAFAEFVNVFDYTAKFPVTFPDRFILTFPTRVVFDDKFEINVEFPYYVAAVCVTVCNNRVSLNENTLTSPVDLTFPVKSLRIDAGLPIHHRCLK